MYLHTMTVVATAIMALAQASRGLPLECREDENGQPTIIPLDFTRRTPHPIAPLGSRTESNTLLNRLVGDSAHIGDHTSWLTKLVPMTGGAIVDDQHPERRDVVNLQSAEGVHFSSIQNTQQDDNLLKNLFGSKQRTPVASPINA